VIPSLLALIMMTAAPAAVASPPPFTPAEATFMRSVRTAPDANAITGDLPHQAGRAVAYYCGVETIVKPGVIIGQCGPDQETVDVFVKLPTGKLKVDDRLRVLGVVETPAQWSDITGHTVYYAIVRAVYVDRLK
jgi:hypothetical protein